MMWKVLQRWKGTFSFLWKELNAASVAPACGCCNRKGFMEYWQRNVQGFGCVRAGGWRARHRGLGHGNPGTCGRLDGNTRTGQHENDTGEHEGLEFDSEVRMSHGWGKKINKSEFVSFINCFNLWASLFNKRNETERKKKSLLLISNSLKVECGKLFRIPGI